MGSLALRPGDSLAILVDGFVNRLQDSQFPSFLLFKLRGLDSYPGGTFTHCSCQPSLDAHISVLISQACLSQHLSEMMDKIAKAPADVKKSVRAAEELP